ncbi:unnamed protein product [Thelazia callipaeda]|uniref:Secreted protein n=1 Tax=Thelazia callipaeda TaxID=103827 RepID=A0A0N5DA72_THECL|nr:unnamed protein product [Thelazia callipaeda]
MSRAIGLLNVRRSAVLLKRCRAIILSKLSYFLLSTTFGDVGSVGAAEFNCSRLPALASRAGFTAIIIADSFTWRILLRTAFCKVNDIYFFKCRSDCFHFLLSLPHVTIGCEDSEPICGWK